MGYLPWDKPHKGRTSDPVALKLIEGGRKTQEEPKGKLTAKQEAFVVEMLKGTTASAAYRKCYDAQNMADATIHSEACLLVANPKVSARLEKGWAEKRRAAVHTGRSLRSFIVERLVEEAEHAGTDAARVGALSQLAKMDFVGLFKEKPDDKDDHRTAAEIRAELEAKLKAAFGNQT
jgi:uncharacterized protein (DUF1778 family)